MKTLSPDSKYIVVIDFDINDINQKTLTYLYSPLVGDALCVFNFFIYEYELINSFNGMPFTIDRATKLLVKNFHSFNKARRLLEAVDLLETFIQDDIVSFKIKKPLNYEEFINQKHFMELIESSISRHDWLMIETNFNLNIEEPQGEEITTSFSTVFNKNINLEQKTKKCELTKIAKTIHPDIEVTDDIRQVLSTQQNLSVAATKDYLKNSIISEDNKVTLSPEKLFNNINSRSSNSIKLSKIDIFSSNDDHELGLKFKEINNYKSNDYLQLSLKRTLKKEEINAIYHLKYIHCLNNAYINLLFEYVLYKNNGHFVAKYMLKLGETIALNSRITNLHTLRTYLITLTNQTTSEFRKDFTQKIKNNNEELEMKPSWEIPQEKNKYEQTVSLEYFGDYNG